MALILFIILILIVGYGLIRYAHFLEEIANQRSCYVSYQVKGAVRGIEGMFVSESMLQYRRKKLDKPNSKF